MNRAEIEEPLMAVNALAREPFNIALMHGLEGAAKNIYPIHKTPEKVYLKATIIPLHEQYTVKTGIQS